MPISGPTTKSALIGGRCISTDEDQFNGLSDWILGAEMAPVLKIAVTLGPKGVRESWPLLTESSHLHYWRLPSKLVTPRGAQKASKAADCRVH